MLKDLEPASGLALLKELQAQAAPKLRPWFAIGMERSSAPEARALFAQACRTEPMMHDPMCQRPGSLTWASPLEELVRDSSFMPAPYLKANPDARANLVAALERCAQDANTVAPERGACLRTLASMERARAVEAARSARDAHMELSEEAGLLLRFPEAGMLRKKLVALRLIPTTAPREKVEEAFTAEEALAAAGRLHRFDVETDRSPNFHDVLMLELAAMAGPELAGAAFEEIPPDESREGSPYQLRAWFRGKRYALEARNLGDWYDLPAVLGLLNSMLRDRGSELRYVTLPTWTQSASVMVGPRQALLKAGEERLIDFEDPDAAWSRGSSLDRSFLKGLR